MPSTHLALYYHLIFATKHREPLINSAWRPDLHRYLGGTANGLGAQSLSVGGTDDHVHQLVRLNATHRLADFVRELKKASSIWARRNPTAPHLAWQEGYAAFTVSVSALSTVQDYIAQQEKHHQRLGFRDELLKLLRRSGVDFNEKYLD